MTNGAAGVRKKHGISALHKAALCCTENLSIDTEACGAGVVVASPALPILMCLSILHALSDDSWRRSNSSARGTALARGGHQLLAVVGYAALDGATERQPGPTGAGDAGVSLPGLSLLVEDSLLGADGAGNGWGVEGGEGRALGAAFSLGHVQQVRATPHTGTSL